LRREAFGRGLTGRAVKELAVKQNTVAAFGWSWRDLAVGSGRAVEGIWRLEVVAVGRFWEVSS